MLCIGSLPGARESENGVDQPSYLGRHCTHDAAAFAISLHQVADRRRQLGDRDLLPASIDHHRLRHKAKHLGPRPRRGDAFAIVIDMRDRSSSSGAAPPHYCLLIRCLLGVSKGHTPSPGAMTDLSEMLSRIS